MVKKLISWIRGIFGPRKKEVSGLNVRLLKKLRRKFIQDYGMIATHYDPAIHDYYYHITYLDVVLVREYEFTREDAILMIEEQVRRDMRKWLYLHSSRYIHKIKYLW